jgi:hypothetical protein
MNRPQDEPRVRIEFGGPSARNIALVSIYTNAEPHDVQNRPQDEPRVKSVQVRFDSPSKSDILLESVYPNDY